MALKRAVLEDGDAIGERQRLALVVGDIEDGEPGQIGVQPRDLLDHGSADLRVERRQGLVEQQHARTHRERARDRHALLLAAGQFARVAPEELLHADDAQRVVDPLFDQRFGGAARLAGRRRRCRRPACAGNSA